MMNKESQEHSSNLFFLSFKAHEQFFAVSPENTDFPKKLFNMKIFSIKFMIKKGYIKFWRKMTHSPKKNMFVSPKRFIVSLCINFCPTLYEHFFIAPMNTSYQCVISVPSTDQEQ